MPEVFVPEDSSFHLTRRNVGRMETESASVCMNMACTTLNEDADGDLNDTGRIPDDITYPRALQRNFDLGQSPVPPTPARSAFLQQNSDNTQQSSFVGETDLSGGDFERDSPTAEASDSQVRQENLSRKSEPSPSVSLGLVYCNGCTLTYFAI